MEERSSMNRTCVLILSSPRSGSSCTTGCLEICGVSLGKNRNDNVNKHNPKGYFENINIYHFHRDSLQGVKHSIFSESRLGAAKLKQLMPKCKQLHGLLIGEFADDKVFGIKDPRALILLPLYVKVLAEMKVHLKIVILKRKPKNIVGSLMNFGFRGSQGKKARQSCAEDLVQLYFKQLKEAEGVYDSFSVQFEDVFDNPAPLMERCCEWIGLEWTPDKETKVKEFVDRKLVHHSG